MGKYNDKNDKSGSVTFNEPTVAINLCAPDYAGPIVDAVQVMVMRHPTPAKAVYACVRVAVSLALQSAPSKQVAMETITQAINDSVKIHYEDSDEKLVSTPLYDEEDK